MKTKIQLLLTLVLLLFAGQVVGQFSVGNPYTPEERNKIRENQKQSWSKLQEAKVAEIVAEIELYKHGVPKGKPGFQTKQQINQNGQTVAYQNYYKAGKLSFTQGFEYDDDDNITKRTMTNRKNRIINATTYAYESNRMVASSTFKGPKAKPTTSMAYTYDSDGRVLETKNTKTRTNKLLFRTVCTYHEDGSKKRIEKFNGKGKLTSATDYSCDMTGKTMSASKADQLVVCERFEHDANGKTYRVLETFVGQKDNYRMVTKYDERNYFIESTTYNQAGNITSQFINTYNEKGHIIAFERRVEGGKLATKSEYERDEKGLALKEVSRNGKGEIVMVQRFSYNFY